MNSRSPSLVFGARAIALAWASKKPLAVPAVWATRGHAVAKVGSFSTAFFATWLASVPLRRSLRSRAWRYRVRASDEEVVMGTVPERSARARTGRTSKTEGRRDGRMEHLVRRVNAAGRDAPLTSRPGDSVLRPLQPARRPLEQRTPITGGCISATVGRRRPSERRSTAVKRADGKGQPPHQEQQGDPRRGAAAPGGATATQPR